MKLEVLDGYLPSNQEQLKNAVRELREVQSQWRLTGKAGEGWSVEIESKYGLTIWRKQFPEFFLHEDRGGTMGWSTNGELQGQFCAWM